jgi:phenylpropionate dioxygenase-like ring-hydroxylating dioxygenase large terminal subunit
VYPYEKDLLERLWFPVARAQDVADGPVSAQLLGHRIVVFRTGSGLAAARDRCPHRGVRLSYVYTEHPGGAKRVVCQVAAPLTEDGLRCRVFFFVAANHAFRDQYGSVAAQVELESRIFAEDVPIVESLDPPEAPLDLDSQAHVRADRYAVAYRKLYRELLDEFASSP